MSPLKPYLLDNAHVLLWPQEDQGVQVGLLEGVRAEQAGTIERLAGETERLQVQPLHLLLSIPSTHALQLMYRWRRLCKGRST